MKGEPKMKVTEARKICEEFAAKHKVIFEDEGECGFGRECVGFLARNGCYLDYNPTSYEDYNYIPECFCDEAVEPPSETPDAYHKHPCMAVLGRGDEAIIQLAQWVNSLNTAGNVRVVEYQNGATGVQAIISGTTSYAVVAGKENQK
jgi:hypothetical protein